MPNTFRIPHDFTFPQLALAVYPIHEADRHFSYSESLGLGSSYDFHLENISFGYYLPYQMFKDFLTI